MESAVLVNAYRPFQLWVRRVIVSGGTWDPFSGSSGAQYFLADEGQRLHVTIIPTPLKVGGPETVEPGQPAQFTADIVGPFQFRRQTPWGDTIHWQYYPGDTLPEPNPYLGGIYLYECTNQPTCSYTPKRNGRMGVHAQVQYNVIGVRGAVVRIDSARLELSCDRYTLTRGENIKCDAKAKPSGTLDSIRWEFVDTAGHTIPGPQNAASWGGRMVVGGTLRVTALLNGSPVAEDTTIRVRARTWSNIRLTVRQSSYPAGHLPAPALVDSARDLGDSHADTLPALPVYDITDGPNAGWSFLEREIPEFGWVVHINDAAFASGSAWYKLQTGGDYVLPSGVIVPNGRCDSHHIPTLRRLTRQHEGLGSSSLTSHADAARVYLRTHAPQNLLERTMAYRSDLIGYTFSQFAYATYWDIASAMELFTAPHTTDNPPGIVDPAPFPCYARPWSP